MPRQVRTARGEIVDFDAIIIKQQLADAPMKVDVARRKEFIDSKETKGRGAKKQVAAPDSAAKPAPVAAKPAVVKPTVAEKKDAPSTTTVATEKKVETLTLKK